MLGLNVKCQCFHSGSLCGFNGHLVYTKTRKMHAKGMKEAIFSGRK